MTPRSPNRWSMTRLPDGTAILTLEYIPENLKTKKQKEDFLISRFEEWRDVVLSEGHDHTDGCRVWAIVRKTLSDLPVFPISPDGAHQPGAVPGMGEEATPPKNPGKGRR